MVGINKGLKFNQIQSMQDKSNSINVGQVKFNQCRTSKIQSMQDKLNSINAGQVKFNQCRTSKIQSL